jgi:hypothetical protein
VFVCSVFNIKDKFIAYGNKASKDVCSWDGAGTPSIKGD